MGKSSLSRWYRWKWSGPITISLGALLLYGGVLFLDTQGEFYDGWSCELLIDYRDKQMSTQNIPMYDQLSLDEKLRYDGIINKDCSLFKP